MIGKLSGLIQIVQRHNHGQATTFIEFAQKFQYF
tara:strand:- start:8 stop:109 length:102 start_codon:yes stop_codon:yes gene_type:complete